MTNMTKRRILFVLLQTTFTFQIPHNMTPRQLLTQIMNKKAITLNSRDERPADFILKVCGQEEYLIGDYPLIQFFYIQDCLAKEITPTLVTLSVVNLPIDADNIYDIPEIDSLKRSRPSFSTLTLRKKGKHISAWKLDEQFVFNVNGISRLNCDTSHHTVEVIIRLF